MKYLLDTNTCIRFMNGRSPALHRKFLSTDYRDIAISTITKAEMFYGSAKSQTPEVSRARQEEFFRHFASLTFDDAAADVYGQIRAPLERAGTPIGQHDMLITAIAVSNNLVLVTHNVSEFGRIIGLAIEDWEEG